MSYQITRMLIIRSSFRGMVVSALAGYIRETLKEKNCLKLIAYQHEEDNRILIMDGTWTNTIAYLYHTDQLHYKAFLHETSAMLVQTPEHSKFLRIVM